eukprot:1161037-Pelagomonas_calceolata.AAC.9
MGSKGSCISSSGKHEFDGAQSMLGNSDKMSMGAFACIGCGSQGALPFSQWQALRTQLWSPTSSNKSFLSPALLAREK